MEKVASNGSLQALGDATNLRPQLQLRPISLPSAGSLLQQHQQQPSSRGVDADGAFTAEAENSENAAPPASASGSCRKRPLDEYLDEPDGPMAAAALPRPQHLAAPPLKKRQRPSEQRQMVESAAAVNLAKRDLQQQQQLLAASAAPAEAASSGSPINLVKRECGITLRCIAERKQQHPLQFRQQHQHQHQQHHQGYVSVPSELPVSDLTRFVLNAFSIGGASPDECDTKLEMPNWKQLTLTDICAEPETTSVGSLLHHVCGAAILRIELPIPESVLPPSSIIRTLLRSLLPPQATQGSEVLWLRQVGCPLAESTLEAYLQSPDNFEFSAADRAVFVDWHNRICLQYLEQMSKAPPSLLALPLPVLPLTSIGRQIQVNHQPAGAEVSMETPPQPASLTAASSPSASAPGSGHRSGRLRTCFDSEVELPLLQQWFAQNPHPSRDQLASYRDALNAQPIRRDGSRRPLDSANLAYWFKNMRATGRRMSSSASGMSASAAATGSSAPKEAEPGEFDSSSSSPTPQAPLRLCVEEEDATDLAAPSSQPQQTAGVNESIESGGGASKRRRTRVFIDPATEIPQLEIWFDQDSHPSSAQFQLYAQVLNGMPFRQRQPHLEAKNVQLWFKNHRAKVKRERLPELTVGDAAANVATFSANTAVTEPDAELTGDADVEVDTIEGCPDETVEDASPQGALELVCKTESCDEV